MTTTTNTTRIEALTNTQLHHARKAKAQKLAAILDAEYPAISLAPTTNEDGSRVTGWCAEASETTIYEGEDLPDLADLLDACMDEGIDPTEGAEEERQSGSVVPEVYRKRYREASSTGQSCGDWLAEWLAERTLDANGKLLVDVFVAMLGNNGVDLTAKWAKARETQGAGWQGRFRMNGRQVLEKQVAKCGVIWDDLQAEFEVLVEVLVDLRTKHAKWLAKEEKREEAETEVAKLEG